MLGCPVRSAKVILPSAAMFVQQRTWQLSGSNANEPRSIPTRVDPTFRTAPIMIIIGVLCCEEESRSSRVGIELPWLSLIRSATYCGYPTNRRGMEWFSLCET